MSQLSNVESLLTAIAKGDSSYLVEPQSRVEALLYEIYLNGGGGGGTGDITRAEVLRLLEDKVDKLVGYGLISDEEAERLKNVDNYDDSEVRGLITDISNSIIDLKDTIKGAADGQFIYDTDEKMTKVVPDGVNKGVVAMVGGKTQKMVQAVPESSEWDKGTCPSVTVNTTDNVVTVIRYDNNIQNIWATTPNIMMDATHRWLGIVKFMGDGSKTIEAFVQFHARYSYKAIKDNEYLVQAFTGTSVDANKLHVGVKFSDDYLTVKFDKRVQIFDLTAMFGAGNEPTEDEFIEMFGYGYVPYTEGELWNAPVTEITSVGKNRFDEIMEIGELNISTGLPIVSTTNLRTVNYQRVKPSTTYYLLTVGANANVCFYDSNKAFISSITGINNNTFTTPSSCAYMKFRLAAAYGLTYNHDVAIIEGGVDVYTPYNKNIFSLDKIVDKFPDYGCSAGDVYNYVDFEEMVYHHKVKEIGFNDLIWTLKNTTSAVTSKYFQSSDISDAKTVFINSICSKYYHGADRTYLNSDDKTYSKYNDGTLYIIVRDDSYSSASSESEFVKANADTKFVYELAQEELIDISDLLLPFKCEPGGTVTFENEHNLDVPNAIIYEKEMK